MKKFMLCKLSLIVVGAVFAMQRTLAKPATDWFDIKFQCQEIDRISMSTQGQMQPAYPGRKVNVTIKRNSVTADGIFFNRSYKIDRLEDGDLRGSSRGNSRDEVFYVSNGYLFHTAIVKNQKSRVIQSQIFSCIRLD